MLSCIVGNNYVNTVDYDKEELKKWSKKGILKCPVCNRKLIYKHGEIREPYFSHEKDSECIYTFYENETKEHALGKVLLYKWLKSLENISNVKLEGYIPETKQRPDLYFEIDDKRFVIEYQCTPILKSEYNTRHELYKLNGIIDIWIAGLDNYHKDDFKHINNGVVYCRDHRVKECELFFNNNNLNYYLDAFNENLFICIKSDITFNSKKEINFLCFVDSINRCLIENDLIINVNYKIKDYISEGGKYFDFKRQCYATIINLEHQKKEVNRLKKRIEKMIKDKNEKESDCFDLIKFIIKKYISSKNIYIYKNYNILIDAAKINNFRFIVYRAEYFDLNLLTKIIFDEHNMNKENIYLYFSRFNLKSYKILNTYYNPKILKVIND